MGEQWTNWPWPIFHRIAWLEGIPIGPCLKLREAGIGLKSFPAWLATGWGGHGARKRATYRAYTGLWGIPKHGRSCVFVLNFQIWESFQTKPHGSTGRPFPASNAVRSATTSAEIRGLEISWKSCLRCKHYKPLLTTIKWEVKMYCKTTNFCQRNFCRCHISLEPKKVGDHQPIGAFPIQMRDGRLTAVYVHLLRRLGNVHHAVPGENPSFIGNVILIILYPCKNAKQSLH